jgi:hypothetical protein
MATLIWSVYSFAAVGRPGNRHALQLPVSLCGAKSRPFASPMDGSLLVMIPGSDLGAVEVQVRPRRRRAALVLVPGAVDGRAVRVLGGGASPEQA